MKIIFLKRNWLVITANMLALCSCLALVFEGLPPKDQDISGQIFFLGLCMSPVQSLKRFMPLKEKNLCLRGLCLQRRKTSTEFSSLQNFSWTLHHYNHYSKLYKKISNYKDQTSTVTHGNLDILHKIWPFIIYLDIEICSQRQMLCSVSKQYLRNNVSLPGTVGLKERSTYLF